MATRSAGATISIKTERISRHSEMTCYFSSFIVMNLFLTDLTSTRELHNDQKLEFLTRAQSDGLFTMRIKMYYLNLQVQSLLKQLCILSLEDTGRVF